MEITEQDIQRKIKTVKQALCQKLFGGETTPEILRGTMETLASEDQPENYYQAEAVKQALQWWEELENSN